MALRRPVMVLAATVVGTVGVVVFVHQARNEDRAKMHAAVERDIELERRKKCAEAGGPCEFKPPGKA